MKIISVIIAVAVSAGAIQAPVHAAGRGSEHFQRRFLNFRLVKKGMTRKEVESVIAPEIIVGYEEGAAGSDQYKPVTLKSLQREEEKVAGGRTFTVLYFLEGVKTADGKITEDELFPVVLEKDTVVGTGWEFMDDPVGGQGNRPKAANG